MGSLTVLRDVNETIRKLLKQNISELSDENSIIFDSPGEIESTTTPRLSVFLYNISENSYLRNTEPEPVNLNQMQYPPITLDLYYIFTPYAQNRETELIILEGLMQTLYDNSVFRGDILQGNLAGSGNEKIRVTPNNLTLDELNKLWSIFPNKAFKLSVSYMLTPVKIPSVRKRDITRVVEKDIAFYSMEHSDETS